MLKIAIALPISCTVVVRFVQFQLIAMDSNHLRSHTHFNKTRSPKTEFKKVSRTNLKNAFERDVYQFLLISLMAFCFFPGRFIPFSIFGLDYKTLRFPSSSIPFTIHISLPPSLSDKSLTLPLLYPKTP